MTTQERINIIDIKDYINMRERGLASNKAYHSIKNRNIPQHGTVIQFISKIDEGFDFNFEPTMETLNILKQTLYSNEYLKN